MRTLEETEDLKLCPFCGGTAEISECSDRSGYVVCTRCRQHGEIWGSYDYSGKQMAIQHWNRRAKE